MTSDKEAEAEMCTWHAFLKTISTSRIIITDPHLSKKNDHESIFIFPPSHEVRFCQTIIAGVKKIWKPTVLDTSFIIYL